jgi:hypothetical protein
MRKIACKIIGHRLSLIQKNTVLNKEYKCSNCEQKFTIDGYGQIVKLNAYWEENNMLFQRLLEKQRAQAS